MAADKQRLFRAFGTRNTHEPAENSRTSTRFFSLRPRLVAFRLSSVAFFPSRRACTHPVSFSRLPLSFTHAFALERLLDGSWRGRWQPRHANTIRGSPSRILARKSYTWPRTTGTQQGVPSDLSLLPWTISFRDFYSTMNKTYWLMNIDLIGSQQSRVS